MVKFRYNLELEMALRNLCGDQYIHFANDAHDPEKVKKALLNWTKKARKKLEILTNYNPNLYWSLMADIEDLEDEVKKVGKEENEWQIIAKLLNLTNSLILSF